jgi:transcriptional regulator GlxA family with amidase domain
MSACAAEVEHQIVARPVLNAEAVAKAIDRCGALSADSKTTLRQSLLGPRQVPEERLRGVTEMLLAELRTSFIAGRVASAVHLERQYFSTFFRLHLGITFSRWRRNVRVACAVYLLTQDVPVAQVACAVGYRTPSELGRALRKVTGLSPGRLMRGVLINRVMTAGPQAGAGVIGLRAEHGGGYE